MGDATAYWPEGASTVTLVNWSGLFAAPDFSFLGQVDLLGSLHIEYLPYIFVLVFTNFFESLSTFGISEAGDLKDADGNPRNIKQSMHVDALAALASAPWAPARRRPTSNRPPAFPKAGAPAWSPWSPPCCSCHSCSSPLLSLVPAIATAPVLIMIGVFMMDTISKIDWKSYEEAIPAFLVILLIPLTYSITLGIALGFIVFVLLKLLIGKAHTVKPIMWWVAALSVFLVMRVQY